MKKMRRFKSDKSLGYFWAKGNSIMSLTFDSKFKNAFKQVTLIGLTFSIMLGCNSTKNIYRSSISKSDFVTVNAVTLSHCGCTEIYAESFKNGKKDFQIFYSDHVARKTIFDYSTGSTTPKLISLLATSNDNFTTAFEDLDLKIFSLIDSAIVNKTGLIYPIRRTIYKGYIADTLSR